MGYTVTYDGVPSTDLTGFICHEVSRGLIGDPRTETEYVGGMPGALVYPEQQGLRTVDLDCSVLVDEVNAPARRAAVREVASWYRKDRMKKLIISDEPTLFDWAMPGAAPKVTEWRQRGHFPLPFVCQPFSYELDVITTDEVADAGEYTFTVTNDGDVWTPMIVEIQAGGTSGFQSVEANGRTWNRPVSLANDGWVTFNTICGTINTGQNFDTDLEGIFETSTLSMEGVTGRPPFLLPGDNDVTVTLTASGSTINVYHRNRYS